MLRLLMVSSVMAVAAPVSAQDVSLDMILKDGEGWKPTGDADGGPPHYTVRRESGRSVIERTGGGPTPSLLTGPNLIADHLDRLTAVCYSPFGEVAFLGCADLRHVWAFPIGPDGVLRDGEPYCPLRTQVGKDEVAVTALTVDALGRIYAATPDGIQAFDPTGRMIGVISLPSKGRASSLGWEGGAGNRLNVTVGGKRYSRVLSVTVVK